MTLDEAIRHCEEVAECNEIAGLESEARRQCCNDHRQLAEWLTELKELKNSIGAVRLSDMKEALELIREYKAENIAQKKLIAEYKRLLKAAVEDLNSIYRVLEDNDILCVKYIACKGCPFNGKNCDKWRYANEALKLIGGKTDEKP